jgi:tRNA1(Val) A37 N6-methylase TrmN6
MTTPEIRPGAGETLDGFYHGRIRILQQKTGYRFAVDAPLLADFIRTGPDEDLLEIGTGCGVIALLLSLKPFRSLIALEVQAELAELARRNVALNGLEGRITVLRTDAAISPPAGVSTSFSPTRPTSAPGAAISAGASRGPRPSMSWPGRFLI